MFILQLCLHLPARAEGYPWTLIYSSEKHGFILKTLYRTMQKIDCPVLIVIKDTASQVTRNTDRLIDAFTLNCNETILSLTDTLIEHSLSRFLCFTILHKYCNC